MSSSPDARAAWCPTWTAASTPASAQQQGTTSGAAEETVLRGDRATSVAAVRLDGDLRRSTPLLRYPGAREELEKAWQSAHTQGYAAGWADGHRAVVEHLRSETERAEREVAEALRAQTEAVTRGLLALNRAADDLESRVTPTMDTAAEALATAAVALAEALLGRELALTGTPGMDAVRRALALAPRGGPLVIRLHPEDWSAVHAALETRPEELSGRDFELLADASVEPAGCVVDCAATRIDAQLGPALARVREVLGG